ncbi:MAG: hypothetical protein ACPHQP_01945 [Longimicrobiales bacterium]
MNHYYTWSAFLVFVAFFVVLPFVYQSYGQTRDTHQGLNELEERLRSFDEMNRDLEQLEMRVRTLENPQLG